MTRNLEVGEVYEGTVKELLGFGALVEILPGKVGLLHVSEITDSFVENVDEWFKVGDKVTAKIISVGDEGKFSLSKRAVDDPNYVPTERNNSRNGGRNGNFRRGDRGDRRSSDRGSRDRR
ncbi:S1 RNA-binding domain-containing protein [Patescibacteria group bacterium]|nr:S1 RNA-binding domain-containing protein [Patescibacteria group bacterium]